MQATGRESHSLATMLKITAIIRSEKLDEVKSALIKAGITGMSVSEGRGFGRQKGQIETYRGSEFRVDFIPKTRIEIALVDEQVNAALVAITEAGRTGEIGDGKIFISQLEEAVRIRTRESGYEAL